MSGWIAFWTAVLMIALMMVLYKVGPKPLTKVLWILTTILALIGGGLLIASPPGSWLTDRVRDIRGFFAQFGWVGDSASLILFGIVVLLVIWTVCLLVNKDAGMGVLVTLVLLPVLLTAAGGRVADGLLPLYGEFADAGSTAVAELREG